MAKRYEIPVTIIEHEDGRCEAYVQNGTTTHDLHRLHKTKWRAWRYVDTIARSILQIAKLERLEDDEELDSPSSSWETGSSLAEKKSRSFARRAQKN